MSAPDWDEVYGYISEVGTQNSGVQNWEKGYRLRLRLQLRLRLRPGFWRMVAFGAHWLRLQGRSFGLGPEFGLGFESELALGI